MNTFCSLTDFLFLPLYALDFSCVKFMTVFVCLCLCLWSWFFLCEVYVCVKPARPLLLFLFLSSYSVTVIFLMTGPSRQSQAAATTFPTFSLFRLFCCVPFPLFGTFWLFRLFRCVPFTLFAEQVKVRRRGGEARGRMGSNFFPLRSDFPLGLRCNLSLFPDGTHTHNNIFEKTECKIGVVDKRIWI